MRGLSSSPNPELESAITSNHEKFHYFSLLTKIEIRHSRKVYPNKDLVLLVACFVSASGSLIMSFSFGFSGDDIEDDEAQESKADKIGNFSITEAKDLPAPKTHTLEHLVSPWLFSGLVAEITFLSCPNALA